MEEEEEEEQQTWQEKALELAEEEAEKDEEQERTWQEQTPRRGVSAATPASAASTAYYPGPESPERG